MVETTTKKKLKPRGRPFPKGQSGNPKGRPLGEIVGNRFAAEMLKVVPAQVGGKTIEAPQYELFIMQMIQAGIKGNTPARKLVLDFIAANDARETAADEKAKQATEGGVGVFNWDDAKERVLQNLQSVFKQARRAERG